MSLLVIVGLFASQLAAFPHAHAGVTADFQERHDASPHVHQNWFCPSDHHHSHAHDGTCPPHSAQNHEAAAQLLDGFDGQPLSIALSGADHDADAIIVPILVGAPPTKPAESIAAASQLAVLVTPLADASDMWPSLRSTPRWIPPDEVLDASHTYLTLRNLRI